MRILLAPMEGLLDYMLRDTLLPARSFYRVVPELKNQRLTPAGVPVRIQLLGSDPICMAENAAKLASLGAFGIDINFGYPAKIVNRHRGGVISQSTRCAIEH